MNAIDFASQRVARAEAALDRAERTHEQRVDELQTIEQRIADTRAKLEGIRDKTRNGELSDTEGGGLYSMFQADLRDLEHLRDEAQRAVDEASTAAFETELSAANNDLKRAQDAALLEALKDHADETVDTLVNVLREIASVGQRVTGKPSLRSHWMPSRELDLAVQFGSLLK